MAVCLSFLQVSKIEINKKKTKFWFRGIALLCTPEKGRNTTLFRFILNMSRFSDWNIDCKVYIGSLGSRATKEDIEDAFSRYGPLRNVWIARNPPGFAFVEFEDRRDAEEAVRELDGSRLCGSRVRVEMSHGKTRSDRRRDDRRNASPPYRRRRYSRSRSRSHSPRHSQRSRRDRSYSRERR